MRADDGRFFETGEKHFHRANIIGCRALLLKLREVHGAPVPLPEPDVVELVPTVVKKIDVGETKAEKRFIRYLSDEAGRRVPTVAEIKHMVATRFEVTPRNLDSRSRKVAYVWPRQVAMFLAHTITLRSLPDIGRRFGGRDHTTVLHAVRKIERLVNENPETASLIDELKEELNDDNSAAVSPDQTTASAHQAAV